MIEGQEATSLCREKIDKMDFKRLNLMGTISSVLSNIFQVVRSTTSIMAPIANKAVAAAGWQISKLVHNCSQHKTVLWLVALIILLIPAAVIYSRRRRHRPIEPLDFIIEDQVDEKYFTESPITTSSQLIDLPPPLRSVYKHEFRFDQHSGGNDGFKTHRSSPWHRRSISASENNSIVSDKIEYFKGDHIEEFDDEHVQPERIWRRRTLEFVS